MSHTQSRPDTRLQIRPLGLAIARGKRQGPGLLLLVWRSLRRQRLPIDADRRCSTVHRPLVPSQHLIGTHGAGGAALHRPALAEAIQNTPDRGIMQRRSRDGLTPQPCRVLVRTARFSPGEGTASTQRVEHHGEDNGPWIDGHLSWDPWIDHRYHAKLVGIGLHEREMLALVCCDRRWHETPTTLQEGRGSVPLLSCDETIPPRDTAGRNISSGKCVGWFRRGAECELYGADAKILCQHIDVRDQLTISQHILST